MSSPESRICIMTSLAASNKSPAIWKRNPSKEKSSSPALVSPTPTVMTKMLAQVLYVGWASPHIQERNRTTHGAADFSIWI
jgi:hypothetical protein